MSELKEKTYRLVGESFAMSFMLKTGRNKSLIIFDESVKGKARNRAIRYCPNEASIFLDEQTDHAISRAIVFENRLLEVKASEQVLQKFLTAHPGNTANGGNTFEELDAAKEAQSDISYDEMITDIKMAVRNKEKEKNGVYELQAVAGVLIGSAVRVAKMSTEELKREIYNAIVNDPKRFVDEKGNVTIFENADITRKYIVLQALNSGVIIVSNDNKSIMWADKTVITNVTPGKTPVDHFADYLSTDDGLLVLTELQKK